MNGFKKIIYRLLCGIKFLYFTIFSGNTFQKNINKWFFLDGDANFLLAHDLNEKSIVFDVGWYTGVFSDAIIQSYNPYIYIFEPVEKYYKILENKYKNNSKIQVFHFWLSDTAEEIDISIEDDASSIFKNNWQKEKILLRNIVDVLKELKIDGESIDLMAINIEWWEYNLLEKLLKNNCYPNSIQVQFHDFVDGATNKRDSILDLLNKSGYKKWYSFPFVWELFKRK